MAGADRVRRHRRANTSRGSARAPSRRRGAWLAMLGLLAWCLAAPAGAGETWSVQAGPAGPGGRPGCVLESARQSLPDGYQTSWAQIEVDHGAIRVHSASVLDPGDGDIGLVVDDGAFVRPDEAGQKAAVFASEYRGLVDAFKRGRRVRVQLRFWPTWPKTDTYSATFSLMGFTRAYAEMSRCRTP